MPPPLISPLPQLRLAPSFAAAGPSCSRSSLHNKSIVWFHCCIHNSVSGMDMDSEIDHYAVLGLSSGEKGAKLTEKEISKAYRSKALELHPDKRPDDPNAHANFQKLKTCYEILKDEKARKLFDDLVRVKQDKLRRQTQQDSKRRKMMSDLEERERRGAYDSDPGLREERINRKLQEEINRIRSQFTNKRSRSGLGSDVPASKKNETTQSTASPLFSSFAPRNTQPLDSRLSNFAGSGYLAFENSVLEKMKKAAQKQK